MEKEVREMDQDKNDGGDFNFWVEIRCPTIQIHSYNLINIWATFEKLYLYPL
jgi:hypothetical protein